MNSIIKEALTEYNKNNESLITILTNLSNEYNIELSDMVEIVKADKTFMEILTNNARALNLLKDKIVKTTDLDDLI